MITTSKDYSGRQVDLSVFPSLATANVPVSSEFGEGKVVAGPMAAAQDFLRILLTATGHYKSDPSLGSDFYSGLSGKNVRFSSDLLHLFMIESDKVLDYLAIHSTNLPDDERITEARLVSSQVIGTSIDLVIELSFVAGNTLTVRLPVQWSI